MRFAGVTDVGLARENNEDYFLLPEVNPALDIDDSVFHDHGYLFVLCDGVGGHADGEVASRMICESLMQTYYSMPVPENLPEHLERLVLAAHRRVLEYGFRHPGSRGLSATLVMLLLRNGRASILTSGDSRIYRLNREGLAQINPDHSEVWSLYEHGLLTKDALRTHPRNYIITSAIGLSRDPMIFQADEEISGRCLYLLCSDGLTDQIPEDEIAHELARPIELTERLRNLVRKANRAGGKDNVTLVAVEKG